MKANELRIGNFVMRPNFPNYEVVDWKLIAKIAQVPDWYIPIPLTEEWLLKFGFEKDKINSSIYPNYNFNGFGLFNSIGVPWEWDLVRGSNYIRNKIQYVHQLQNLYFALTGQELIIK
jgi:hypothetical protein